MDAAVANDHSEQHIIEKVLHVHINGSINDFDKGGPDAAQWRPLNGKAAEVFGISDLFDSHTDAGQTAAVLQNAVLHEIEVIEVQNDFPCNMAVTISCIPGDESTRHGQRYALTSLAGSHMMSPQKIFSSEQSNHEGIEWRSRYPMYNASNLETQGILQVVGQPYVFVNLNHPVVDLLRTNADKLNASIDNQPLIDNEWYKVTKQVLSQCCQVLRSKILDKVSTRDMNDFTVQLHRPGTSEWINKDLMKEIESKLTVGDIATKDSKARILAHTLSHPRSWSARLRVKYEINTQ